MRPTTVRGNFARFPLGSDRARCTMMHNQCTINAQSVHNHKQCTKVAQKLHFACADQSRHHLVSESFRKCILSACRYSPISNSETAKLRPLRDPSSRPLRSSADSQLPSERYYTDTLECCSLSVPQASTPYLVPRHLSPLTVFQLFT